MEAKKKECREEAGSNKHRMRKMREEDKEEAEERWEEDRLKD